MMKSENYDQSEHDGKIWNVLCSWGGWHLNGKHLAPRGDMFLHEGMLEYKICIQDAQNTLENIHSNVNEKSSYKIKQWNINSIISYIYNTEIKIN